MCRFVFESEYTSCLTKTVDNRKQESIKNIYRVWRIKEIKVNDYHKKVNSYL